MGAEALCRGAAQVIGVEKASKACAVIRQNWKAVASPEQSFRLVRGDVVQHVLMLQGHSFDLIYFDPPYASGLYLPVLEAIATSQLLADSGEVAVEHNAAQHLPDSIPPLSSSDPSTRHQLATDSLSLPEVSPSLHCCRRKKYGSTLLTFFE